MKSKNQLLKEISGVQFAKLECDIFLDTHPNDRIAIENQNKYLKSYQYLVDMYEKQYGPLTLSYDFGNSDFSWTNSPWPWEQEAN